MKKVLKIIILLTFIFAAGRIGAVEMEQQEKDSARYLQVYGYDYTVKE